MTIDLSACLAHTMTYEGGWANVPGDRGGPTNYGITLPTLRQVRRTATLEQLRALSPVEAKEIYRTLYYVPVGADRLPAGVDLMAGDMAVNAGVDRAARIMQQALGVTVDGHAGPATIAAAGRADAVSLIVEMGVLQASFYCGLAGFGQFGNGWLNRVRDRTIAALSMASCARAAA